MGEGPLEPEIKHATSYFADGILKVTDPVYIVDGLLRFNDAKDNDYYQPDKNTGTTWEKFGQREIGWSSKDELVFGLPNRLYPKK
jgi:hypothetical protein